jgi:plasmid maintenance system antidote protein VapI
MIRLDGPDELYAAQRREWLRSGVTLVSIAEGMGQRAPQRVSQILDGSLDIRMSTALKVARALGYDLALIPREEP